LTPISREFCFLLAALTVAPLVVAQQSGRTDVSQEAGRTSVYDGRWWLNADPSTRTGFLEGIRDYLVASGEKGPAGTAEYGVGKISGFYTQNIAERSLLVPAAWKRVLADSPPPKASPGAEVWEGPHGYYRGRWYYTGARGERLGYLEAYLWCLRTYAKVPAAAYPRSLEFYDGQITGLMTNNEGPAWRQPVADLLARFRSAVGN